MKSIKTFIVLFLITSAIQAQTIQDAKKAIEAEFYFKAKKILVGINKTAPTVESNYYLGNVYTLTAISTLQKFITKKQAK